MSAILQSVYRGVIPADCWHEPYMPEAELARRPDLQFADKGALIGWDPVARKPRWRRLVRGCLNCSKAVSA